MTRIVAVAIVDKAALAAFQGATLQRKKFDCNVFGREGFQQAFLGKL
ncbi:MULTISPECIES: hypothetical protein [Agrobacterium tumefaciens complex]|nr:MULTISPECIES: hypothetical protein [Agrobacterium tumefaciens complex]MCP2134495.1 hypothetical protein [Rhizobium sp. SLBN-94]WQE41298.1 hypothetical protein U0027_07265 [Agrobacterium tumefaciens]